MHGQTGTCTVSDSHCVRTQFAKKAAAASLHCTTQDPVLARVIDGCCSPATTFARQPSSSGHEAYDEAGNI